jgi:flagellar L-ring protein precursor FlgH
MSISSSRISALGVMACLSAAKAPPADFSPSHPVSVLVAPATGAIYQATTGYAPLTSGTRASSVGDILTVILIERTQAVKSATQGTDRSGSFGVSPPVSGPFAFFAGSDLNMGGAQSFKGTGQAAQSNALTGEISVTIVAAYSNGTMLVRGEKTVTLNRGDEFVRISGLVRTTDIGFDNRVLSTRVADARITFTGKGEVARASRQGWLQRFFSIVSPF